MTTRGRVITLYMKPGCHLCEELREALDALPEADTFDVEEIDITGDPALFERYRYEIPVLFEGGREIGRGRIEVAEVRRKLQGSLTRVTPVNEP